jgi:hypothetical protein
MILAWIVGVVIFGSGVFLSVENYTWEKDCAKHCGGLGVEKCELKTKTCECYD